MLYGARLFAIGWLLLPRIAAAQWALNFCFPVSPVRFPASEGGGTVYCPVYGGWAPEFSAYYENDQNGYGAENLFKTEAGIRIRYHLGADFNGQSVGGCPAEDHGACDIGDPVYAIAEGRVVFAVDLGATGDWGRIVVVRHAMLSGSPVYSVYAHLNSIEKSIQDCLGEDVGTKCDVGAGKMLGTIGDERLEWPPHLHLEVRRSRPYSLEPLRFVGEGYTSDPQEPWTSTDYVDPFDFINDRRALYCPAVQSTVKSGSASGCEELGATLAASPSSGTEPLIGVDLIASAETTLGGPITYTFHCDEDDTDYVARFVDVSANPKLVVDACDYAVAGTFRPRAVVERGGLVAEARATVVVSAASSTCWLLTRERNAVSGGSLPLVGLENSSGCPASTYRAGQQILVAAVPSTGWSIASWSGTINNASTAQANAVVMPDGPHTVRVNYTNSLPTCYDLERDHTGSGDDPVATPSHSPSCPTGDYVAGELISVEADPDSGWTVDSWDGTENDGSTSTLNAVRMPARNHTVDVTYETVAVEEYELTVEVVGSGQGRVRSSPGSVSCGNYPGGGTNCDHVYDEGTRVELTATPRDGSAFSGWEGDDDCDNSVVYMRGPRFCRARFSTTSTTCRASFLRRFGEGTIPVASPESSGGCPSGYYIADTAITVSGASAAAGWRIVGWQDTENDASTGGSNSVLMPPFDVDVIAIYGRIGGRPTVETGDAGVDGTSATLNGLIHDNGSVVQFRFDYGRTTDYGSSTATFSPSSVSAAIRSVSIQVGGLQCGALYHYRVVASNTAGTSFGEDVSFFSAPCPGVSISALTAVLDESDGPSPAFEFTRTSPGEALTIAFSIGGTAAAGVDYTGLEDPFVTLEDGETTKVLLVNPIADALGGEGDETIAVTLDPSDDYIFVPPATAALTFRDEAPAGQEFFTVAPCRMVDTRSGVGVPGGGGALASGQAVTIPVAGSCGVPDHAVAIAGNLTVVGPTGAGHVALFPYGSAIPGSRALNFASGATRANNFAIAIGADDARSLSLRPIISGGGTVHVVIDVVGYFSPALPPAGVRFSDDFNDNVLDPSRWAWYGNTVREVDGELHVDVEVTDAGGGANTVTFPLAPEGVIVLTRRTKVFAANNRFDGSLIFLPGGDESKRFGIAYANYADASCPVQGFALYRNNANSHICADQGVDVTEWVPGVFGQWFEERFEYDPVTGGLAYWLNGAPTLTMNVGSLPTGSTTLQLRLSTWGWNTGHYQYTDDFVVEQQSP